MAEYVRHMPETTTPAQRSPSIYIHIPISPSGSPSYTARPQIFPQGLNTPSWLALAHTLYIPPLFRHREEPHLLSTTLPPSTALQELHSTTSTEPPPHHHVHTTTITGPPQMDDFHSGTYQPHIVHHARRNEEYRVFIPNASGLNATTRVDYRPPTPEDTPPTTPPAASPPRRPQPTRRRRHVPHRPPPTPHRVPPSRSHRPLRSAPPTGPRHKVISFVTNRPIPPPTRHPLPPRPRGEVPPWKFIPLHPPLTEVDYALIELDFDAATQSAPHPDLHTHPKMTLDEFHANIKNLCIQRGYQIPRALLTEKDKRAAEEAARRAQHARNAASIPTGPTAQLQERTRRSRRSGGRRRNGRRRHGKAYDEPDHGNNANTDADNNHDDAPFDPDHDDDPHDPDEDTIYVIDRVQRDLERTAQFERAEQLRRQAEIEVALRMIAGPIRTAGGGFGATWDEHEQRWRGGETEDEDDGEDDLLIGDEIECDPCTGRPLAEESDQEETDNEMLLGDETVYDARSDGCLDGEMEGRDTVHGVLQEVQLPQTLEEHIRDQLARFSLKK
ncbi:hypothetical protein EDC01DRAFT_763615 [Geopyxis carbonaria]|nr:hypothetical protein EDC01DRAFT_763615 [Geopyxis carbonaria]